MMRHSVFACAITMALAGCASDPAGPPANNDGGSNVVVANSIEYRAATILMESLPPLVSANVQITNTTSNSATINFPDGCLVHLRVYRDSARTSLAYDSQRAYGCTQAIVPVTIAAGQSKTLGSPTISAANILGDSLPNATYYFSAVVRPDGNRLVLQAGSAYLAK